MLAVTNRLIYMAIPAPNRFTDLRQHLHDAGIDSAYLSLTLEQYLAREENMPKADWFNDPHEDHQAWQFREAVIEFMEMTQEKPDEGNGDEAS